MGPVKLARNKNYIKSEPRNTVSITRKRHSKQNKNTEGEMAQLRVEIQRDGYDVSNAAMGPMKRKSTKKAQNKMVKRGRGGFEENKKK